MNLSKNASMLLKLATDKVKLECKDSSFEYVSFGDIIVNKSEFIKELQENNDDDLFAEAVSELFEAYTTRMDTHAKSDLIRIVLSYSCDKEMSYVKFQFNPYYIVNILML